MLLMPFGKNNQFAAVIDRVEKPHELDSLWCWFFTKDHHPGFHPANPEQKGQALCPSQR